ncbi:pyridoxal phosphate-dependent aminotransferase [Steroidobacter sp.]|uniref:pyridoxal phosphate-dependent aminotransferase n=1 Tax=Steroidobacter sp. TaxID=1978227 RepID=UPI001A5553F1|nr:pyridoxal phosphate-dependent aminotransferase [Steroidobacter sp.]MBL8267479.1 pyridoxal phosphate-dependent aminotransferase [Steroidobacter sp.]
MNHGLRTASRLNGISVSSILALSERARLLRLSGVDVIDLTVGEPDQQTPEPIKAAATLAMAQGRTKYTPLAGTPELLKAIAERYATVLGIPVAPNQVISGTGAKQVIFNALLATLDPGEEVIVPAPYWTSYLDMIRVTGGVPRVVSGAWNPERGWRLDTAAMQEALHERTRWIILNSPSNPTGSMATVEELAKLADLLKKWPNTWVLLDEIYADIVFGSERAPNLVQLFPELAARTLVVGGVSKSHAMTGWRLGWGVGPVELIKAMATVQSQNSSAPSSISQAAAVAALNLGPEPVQEMVEEYRARRDIVVRGLNAIPGCNCPVPEGAFYAFADFRGLIGGKVANDVELCEKFLNDAGVAVVPGSAFGAPGFVRLSFATSQAKLHEALQRMREAARKIQA